MKKRISGWLDGNDTTLLLSLGVWLCALPLVMLLGLLLQGWQGALTAALSTLIAALLVCHAICYFPEISAEDFHK